MWIVYLKEMLELLRDKKTIYFTIVVPIMVFPLLFFGFGYISSDIAKKELNGKINYSIIGSRNSKELSNQFFYAKNFNFIKFQDEESAKKAVSDGAIKFVIVIPDDFSTTYLNSRQASILIHYNGASSGEITMKRINSVIDTFNTKIRNDAQLRLGLNLESTEFILKPILVDAKSIASDRERIGALIGGILPYFLLIVCLMSSMYPAIDLGAGEKERGTLESLLLAPIPRKDLVLAKFLVLFTFGTVSATIMVASMCLLLHTLGTALDPDLALIAAELNAVDYLMIEFMLMPTSAVFSAILLAVSIYAKNYKEASGFSQPIVMVSILPIALAVMPGVQLSWFWSIVPLTNISLAMKELVKGTMDYRMFFTIFLSTSVIALVGLWICRWWFEREEVLFRN